MTHPLQTRIDIITKIVDKHPAMSAEHRDRLLIERRSLLRIVHQIPQQAQLPLDWTGPEASHV